MKVGMLLMLSWRMTFCMSLNYSIHSNENLSLVVRSACENDRRRGFYSMLADCDGEYTIVLVNTSHYTCHRTSVVHF